jgi:hypothetical protein
MRLCGCAAVRAFAYAWLCVWAALQPWHTPPPLHDSLLALHTHNPPHAHPRQQVKAAATSAGSATFRLVGNRDIEHILDDLLHCVARPAEVPDVVSKLSATTFVQVRAAGMPAGGGRGACGARRTLPPHTAADPRCHRPPQALCQGGGRRVRRPQHCARPRQRPTRTPPTNAARLSRRPRWR